MHVGFTGTRFGMTRRQRDEVRGILLFLQPTHVHHGDCIGSDDEFHSMVREILPSCTIVVHPPKYTSQRAFCVGDQTRKPDGYLDRNRAIVQASDRLIATPHEMFPVLRSGTWATVRYAQAKPIPCDIIYPKEQLK